MGKAQSATNKCTCHVGFVAHGTPAASAVGFKRRPVFLHTTTAEFMPADLLCFVLWCWAVTSAGVRGLRGE